jgi:polygalacturonase
VSGVTYKDITLSGITKYGIVIEQDYENGSPTGTPTTGVPITDLTLDNVKGTVSSSGTDILYSVWERQLFRLDLGEC